MGNRKDKKVLRSHRLELPKEGVGKRTFERRPAPTKRSVGKKSHAKAAAASARPQAKGVKTHQGQSVLRSSARPASQRQPAAKKAKAPAQSRPAQAKKSVDAKNALTKRPSGHVRAQPKKVASGPQPRTASGSQEFGGFYRRHLKAMVPLTLLVVVVVGFGVFDVASSWGKIHPGVTMQGIDIGGLTVEQAAQKLQDGLSPHLDEASLTVYEGQGSDVQADSSSNVQLAYAAEDDGSHGSDSNGDGEVEEWSVSAETVGAYIDGTALAESAYRYGREGNFLGDRIAAWFGGKQYNATISCNAESFNGLVDDINDAIGEKIVDSKAKISDGTATLSEGSDGWLVDEQLFVERLSDVFFDPNATYCIVPMHTVSMHIKPETAQKVVDQINGAISSDVTIIYGADTWTMDAGDLGDVIGQSVLEPDQYLSFGNSTQKVETGDTSQAVYDMTTGYDSSSGYTLQAYVDQKKLDSYLVDLLGDRATGGAESATFDTSSGEVVITPSKTGTGPDRAAAELTVQDMLFGENVGQQESRTVTLQDTTIEPSLTTEEARAMGIEEELSSWSIPMSGSSGRRNNIELLCSMIDGSLVAPGDTWSFNDTTGERTADKGFDTAPVIVNGRHEDQLGGGICQVATCVFNSACYAGLGIGTRANHSFYISAYDDEGFADATVSWPEPDLQWVNDTDHYILLTAGIEDDEVVVRLWGTDDGRTVTCERGEWKEGDKYRTIKENDSSLKKGESEVVQSGHDGREIYIRYIAKSKDGEVLHDINFHSVYQAQNEIIKVGTG